MAEMPSGPTIDPRLRDYLDAELRLAEADFARPPRPAARRSRGWASLATLFAAVAVLVLVIAGSQLLGRSNTSPAAVQMGADGLPTMVDGQPVLRLSDVFPTPASARSFLVGGTLTLASDPCPDLSGSSPVPCDESWQFMDSAGTIGIHLADVAGAPGFVRTIGALTVVRVSATPPCDHCAGSYEVEAVVWRQPTKGPEPTNVSPPEGGPVFYARVPDFVSTVGRDGMIVGYTPKAYLLGPFPDLPGSPSNPPQNPPMPVYGEDLTTLVGHMVAGVGFVALGATAPPVSADVSVAPSAAPATHTSASPSPSVIQSGLFTWYPVDTTPFGGASVDQGTILYTVTRTTDGRLLGSGRVDGGGSSFWISADGLAWSRMPGSSALTPATPSGSSIAWSAVALDVAGVGSGYVAVGMDQAGDASSANAAAWTSNDGAHWTRATVDDGTGRTMNQIFATKDGMVAIGEAGYSFHPGMGFGTAIWTSSDGKSWTRLPAKDAPPVGTRLSGVVAVTGGYLATAAFEAGWGAEQGQEHPVTIGVWRSTDAVHWQPIAGTPLGISAIAVASGWLVGVGPGKALDPVPGLVWRSTDGVSWTSSPLPTPSGVPAGVGARASMIVGTVGGLLAIGERQDDYSMVTWSSSDGTTWSADDLPAPSTTLFRGAIQLDGAALVLGGDPSGSSSAIEMWLVTGTTRFHQAHLPAGSPLPAPSGPIDTSCPGTNPCGP